MSHTVHAHSRRLCLLRRSNESQFINNNNIPTNDSTGYHGFKRRRTRVSFATTAIVDEEERHQTKQHAFYDCHNSETFYAFVGRAVDIDGWSVDLGVVTVIVINVNDFYNGNAT